MTQLKKALNDEKWNHHNRIFNKPKVNGINNNKTKETEEFIYEFN